MIGIFRRILPKPFVADVYLTHEEEAAFQREITMECRHTLRQNWPFLMFIYVSFILIDMVLMPDVAPYDAASRVFLVSPLLVALIFSFTGEPGSRIDMSVIVAIALVICGQFMLFSAASSAPYAFCYAFLAPIVPITAFVGAPLTRQQNLQFSATCCIVVIGIVFASHFPTEVKIVTPLFILSVSAMGYLGTWTREAIRRQIFIERLKETGRREVAENAANHDALTGLPNRRAMENWIQSSGVQDEKAETPVCVFMVDIDHFKQFNDRFGHGAGDECLRQIAAVLKVRVRRGSLCARYGGEEFILICNDCTAAEGQMIGERLVEAVRTLALPHVAPAPGSVVTVSVGYFSSKTRDRNLAKVIEQADAALYRAKHLGRNRVWGTDHVQDALPGQSHVDRL